MKDKKKIRNIVGLYVAFIVCTVLVKCVDVGEIGPSESTVGFSTLNSFFHRFTGVNMTLYTITDWLGLVPIAMVMGFGVLGLVQWIRRKSILKVDRSLIVLGIVYVAVVLAYIFFEIVIVNYRPVLIGGILEASYPSSTTLLTMCIVPTAIMQLNIRIKHNGLRRCIAVVLLLFTVFMVIGRAVSGVHWITDIIGGVLLSAGFVSTYAYYSV